MTNTDMEKIIEELNECVALLDCIGTQNECKKYVLDVIAMLKEWEPVEPNTDSEGTLCCGNCGETVGYFPAGCSTPLKYYKFCPWCGRPVKWE